MSKICQINSIYNRKKYRYPPAGETDTRFISHITHFLPVEKLILVSYNEQDLQQQHVTGKLLFREIA